MVRVEYKKIVTKAGEAWYPHLSEPEIFEGQDQGLTIKVKFPEEVSNEFLSIIEAEWEAYKATLDPKSKFVGEPYLGFTEKDGDRLFKFKSMSSYKKDGQVFKKTVPVFDAARKPCKVALGNGSTVKVACQLVPFYKSNKTFGVSLWMDAVQVIKLVEFRGGSGASYGFEEEEGFKDEADESQDLPFPAGDTKNGDF